jgi:hypothetical protein
MHTNVKYNVEVWIVSRCLESNDLPQGFNMLYSRAIWFHVQALAGHSHPLLCKSHCSWGYEEFFAWYAQNSPPRESASRRVLSRGSTSDFGVLQCTRCVRQLISPNPDQRQKGYGRRHARPGTPVPRTCQPRARYVLLPIRIPLSRPSHLMALRFRIQYPE